MCQLALHNSKSVQSLVPKASFFGRLGDMLHHYRAIDGTENRFFLLLEEMKTPALVNLRLKVKVSIGYKK